MTLRIFRRFTLPRTFRRKGLRLSGYTAPDQRHTSGEDTRGDDGVYYEVRGGRGEFNAEARRDVERDRILTQRRKDAERKREREDMGAPGDGGFWFISKKSGRDRLYSL